MKGNRNMSHILEDTQFIMKKYKINIMKGKKYGYRISRIFK